MLLTSYLLCSINCYLQVLINYLDIFQVCKNYLIDNILREKVMQVLLFTRLGKKTRVILNKIFAPSIKKMELNTYI